MERLDLESVPDDGWTDRAALDCSREFERHRRSQSARTRELLKIIDAFCNLRKAAPEPRRTNGTCQIAEVKGPMVEGETATEKAPSQANSGSTQVIELQRFKSYMAEPWRAQSKPVHQGWQGAGLLAAGSGKQVARRRPHTGNRQYSSRERTQEFKSLCLNAWMLLFFRCKRFETQGALMTSSTHWSKHPN